MRKIVITACYGGQLTRQARPAISTGQRPTLNPEPRDLANVPSSLLRREAEK